jgi:8-oxo-dGTP pyrophosphatase MutT (NUDIX family)
MTASHPMKPASVAFRFIGQFNRADVITKWVDSLRLSNIEIENQIEQAWRQARSRPGVKLFDGPLCRLERFSAGKTLELELSRTSYKIFWGTNLTHPDLADRFGPEVLANPVGLSCALQSSDGYLMLGRRNVSLAYYPLRVHPFAGSLEPAERVDVFANMERELSEELSLTAEDISQIVCVGMIEDLSLRQPELIFSVRSNQSRARIEQTLDAGEHDVCVAIEPKEDKLLEALNDPALTPVALGTGLLWGRGLFGAEWFDAANRAVNLGRHEPH